MTNAKFKQASLIAALILITSIAPTMAKEIEVARIGNEVITLQEFNEKLKSFPAQYAEALKQKETRAKLLDQLISEKLILSQATLNFISMTSYNHSINF